MKFMALLYGEEAQWDALSAGEREAAYERYGSFASEASEAGVLLGGEELASASDATTVRVRGDETVVTDGPYAEVKEALGGFFVFDCRTMDDAVDYAARIPGAETGAVEVRALYVDEGAPS